jgi:hypothetical protein
MMDNKAKLTSSPAENFVPCGKWVLGMKPLYFFTLMITPSFCTCYSAENKKKINKKVLTVILRRKQEKVTRSKH